MYKIFILTFSLLLIISFDLVGQDKLVTGRVTDHNNEPIPGVNIIVRGLTKGTVTDADGKYAIGLPPGYTILVYSFVGMLTEEIRVTTESTLDVTLYPDIQSLSELVVTGYTYEKLDRLSGSVGTVESKEMEDIPIPSFDQVLQGKTAGLYISSGSGQPGSSATVRLRGSGSINAGNTPLYILDNVPISATEFSTLNVNDFESVSVLKDASATAIYGSRGANGVIVITSKNGKKNTSSVTYRMQYGVSQQAREKFEMMNSAEKIAFEQFMGRGPAGQLDPNNPTDKLVLDQYKNTNTNWKDIFIRNGKLQSHEVAFSGGNEKTTYYTSLAYLDQEGQALKSDLKRYTLRMNLSSNVSEKLRFDLNSSIGYSESNVIPSEGQIVTNNPFATVYLANPYVSPYNESGDYNTGPGLVGPNTLEFIEEGTRTNDQIKSVLSASGQFNIAEPLYVKSTFGIDYTQTNFERYISPESYDGGTGSFGQSQFQNFSYIWTNLLGYSKDFSDHFVEFTLGHEIYLNSQNTYGYVGFGINPKLPETPEGITPGSADGSIPQISGGKNSNSLHSLFAIGNYSFKDKYNIKASIRRDGSSRFGANNRFALFWSLGASWSLKKESFLENSQIIDELKVRASYGTVGNQTGIGNFQSLPTYTSVSYGALQGNGILGAGNPDLKWEVSNQTNIGIDFSFLNTKIYGSLDLYNNITSDLFVEYQFSRTTGFESIESNEGKMSNKGIEFTLNADIVTFGEFIWTLGGNIAYNKNQILDLGQVSEFEFGTSIVKVGLPLGSHYIQEWAGVNPSNGEPLYVGQNGEITNDYDAAGPKAVFGTSQPPITGGFFSAWTFKGLKLDAFFTFAHGYSRYNNQLFFSENPNFVNFNLSKKMNTMWKEPGDITEIQSYEYERQFSSKDIEDASFLRLRNVRLSYSFSEKLLEKTKGLFQGLDIYVQGQNLMTWTEFTGFDPEDGNNIATFEYPASKVYSVGLSVKF
ncbi:SusC/RagA family TonB-linked outer membrane protein [Marinigracilibium pacificum]|uniref:TonB-dependent receptor n=1 Tax=Marinigracilibium pacificum TaxID=2729599 RepID=A0A848J4K6_9BACT|nr:TonB-dependent receptor [Marinigracilibium pacificum]NMM50691.1 TonB-dependent receptor [Marinigracilibium pacificum]